MDPTHTSPSTDSDLSQPRSLSAHNKAARIEPPPSAHSGCAKGTKHEETSSLQPELSKLSSPVFNGRLSSEDLTPTKQRGDTKRRASVTAASSKPQRRFSRAPTTLREIHKIDKILAENVILSSMNDVAFDPSHLTVDCLHALLTRRRVSFKKHHTRFALLSKYWEAIEELEAAKPKVKKQKIAKSKGTKSKRAKSKAAKSEGCRTGSRTVNRERQNQAASRGGLSQYSLGL